MKSISRGSYFESTLEERGYTPEDEEWILFMKIRDRLLESSANNTDKRRILRPLKNLIHKLPKKELGPL